MQDKYNIQILSVNIKLICTRCERGMFLKLIQINYIFPNNVYCICIVVVGRNIDHYYWTFDRRVFHAVVVSNQCSHYKLEGEVNSEKWKTTKRSGRKQRKVDFWEY